MCLVGFDDNPPNDVLAPWPSSVRVPYPGFGAPVVRVLPAISTGNPPLTTVLPHNLVARDMEGI